MYHIGDHGKLEKLTPVRYGADYNLDKPSILLAVMEKLPRTGGRGGDWGGSASSGS